MEQGEQAGACSTGFSAGTLVEAVEGPVPVQELAGKGMPVLTRLSSGARGFRIIGRIEASATPVPVVRVRLDNGHTVTMAGSQVVFRGDGTTLAAKSLSPGDRLEASFFYPPGYRLRGVSLAGLELSEPGFRVLEVTAAGQEIVYQGRVKETGCLFLHAGILCAARPTS